MIKRICTALIAVMIGAGAFTVPAFAYTGEDAVLQYLRLQPLM